MNNLKRLSTSMASFPKLLEILEISGCLVTIDAMGCQTETAKKIVDSGADYVLAVKGNQPTLFEGIQDFFIDHLEDDFARTKVSLHETKEKGHSRVEHRSYYVCPVPDNLPDRARWKDLVAIGVAINVLRRTALSLLKTTAPCSPRGRPAPSLPDPCRRE